MQDAWSETSGAARRPLGEAALRVDGKVAVVTGASAGLGERFARVLHTAGARVAVTARREERLERLARSSTARSPSPAT